METIRGSEQNEHQVTAATNDPEKLQSSKSNSHEQGVYKGMSPVLYTLNVFGINLHRHFKQPCHKPGVANILWCVYNTTVFLFLVANVCRLMRVYQLKDTTELQLIFNIQNTLWITHNVAHYTIFYFKSLISSQFDAFLVSYQEYADEYCKGILSIKQIAYKCVTLFWCLFLLDFASSTCHVYIHDTYDGIVRWPLHNDDSYETVMELIYTAFKFYMIALWFGTTLITCFVSICLLHEYKVINKEILQLSHSGLLQRLEHFRRRHYRVGNLTGLFDKFISLHFAIDVTCDLTQCCLILYEMIWDRWINNEIGPSMTFTCWITVIILKVIIVLFCAGILNDAVSNCRIHFSH